MTILLQFLTTLSQYCYNIITHIVTTLSQTWLHHCHNVNKTFSQYCQIHYHNVVTSLPQYYNISIAAIFYQHCMSNWNCCYIITNCNILPLLWHYTHHYNIDTVLSRNSYNCYNIVKPLSQHCTTQYCHNIITILHKIVILLSPIVITVTICYTM